MVLPEDGERRRNALSGLKVNETVSYFFAIGVFFSAELDALCWDFEVEVLVRRALRASELLCVDACMKEAVQDLCCSAVSDGRWNLEKTPILAGSIP